MIKIFNILMAIWCIFFVLGGGCISLRKTGEREGSAAVPTQTTPPSFPPAPPGEVTTPIPIVTPTPEPRSSVVYTNETYPPEEFPLSREEVVDSQSAPPRDPVEIFRESFTLKYANIALLVDVVRAPFVLEFTTGAEDPNPLYSFVIVTIRDADTKKIIAEDGYGRQYSTERDKRIVVYRKGRFHVNIYGNRVRTEIRVKTMDISPPETTAPPARGREEPEY